MTRLDVVALLLATCSLGLAVVERVLPIAPSELIAFQGGTVAAAVILHVVSERSEHR